MVQPLATEATGKAKKFERTGPQEFVSFLFEELTIDNVVAACNQHFKGRLKGMTCEILASVRGPSCSKLCQLPNLKLIHIRFVMASATDKYNPLSDFDYETEAKTLGGSSGHDTPSVNQSVSVIKHSAAFKRKNKEAKIGSIPIKKSISVTAMLKMGKVISDTSAPLVVILVSQFNVDKMHWSSPVATQFAIEEKEFARGGFRSAFKASSNAVTFHGKCMIVKKFLPATLENIQIVNETPEFHAKKSVQMHTLAQSLASQLAISVEKGGNKDFFGHCF